jgi:hypothetical protein
MPAHAVTLLAPNRIRTKRTRVIAYAERIGAPA